MKHRRNPLLSDTQLILLSAASQRDDLLLPPPHLRGGAATRVAGSLITNGLVAETTVSFGQPSWREDANHGKIGLKITKAGLREIGVDDPEPVDKKSARTIAEPELEKIEPRSDKPPVPAFRDGTKKALVLALLHRDEGAFLDDLTEATGWLAHTTRAALTGLRHSGVTIERTKASDGRSVYRALPARGEA
ncbi:DUF3489 domain-containing protein [Microvirga brassicacearum]|uniref:DUF3489 domain-containing protein n=1 Tax=Microvirga brassicacearum TaxID=2580413 RepID=A0A5N3PHC3_9HYPH|nr:DUF3489 domain-containing protein [Microvirga brassicacearum]KAB0269141.1 DUF3489 domain-containing protein [Microvirga brassicacearum]